MKNILRALHDMRVYFLIIPFCILLYWIDPVIFETWIQWGAALPIIVGVMLVVRKILFPTVDLSEMIKDAAKEPIGAGLVVLSVTILSATFLMAATLWLSH